MPGLRGDDSAGRGQYEGDPRQGLSQVALAGSRAGPRGGGEAETGRDLARWRSAFREVASMLDVVYRPQFLAGPGREPYALYAELASALGGRALDLGTCGGASALALATGGARVDSWDLNLRAVSPALFDHHRITIRQGDAVAALETMPLDDVRLIVMDLDPHDGIQEERVCRILGDRGWVGTLVADDIHLNPEMGRWWGTVPQPREDATGLGHFTGTGLILCAGGSHGAP